MNFTIFELFLIILSLFLLCVIIFPGIKKLIIKIWEIEITIEWDKSKKDKKKSR